MANKQNGLILVLALVAGLVGGVVSSQFLVGQDVFAKAEIKRTEDILKVVEADIVKARHSIILVDDSGKAKAELRHFDGMPELVLRGRLKKLKSGSIRLGFINPEKPAIWLDVLGSSATNIFSDTLQMWSYSFSDDGLVAGKTNERAELRVIEGNVGLYLYDKDGNERIALGTIGLETKFGETIKRPVSSLVMFDKKGNVVWQAP